MPVPYRPYPKNPRARPTARIDQPAPGALDRKCREHAGAVGAGIDPDPVRPLLDVVADRVAVDDDEAVVALVEQERLTNPPEVGLALLVDRHALEGSVAGCRRFLAAKVGGRR